MKKMFLLSLLVAYMTAHAQTDSAVAMVQYSFTHINDSTQPDRPIKSKMVLLLGNNMSRYGVARPPEAKGMVSMNDVPMENVKSISVINGAILVNGTMMVKEYSYNNSLYKDMASSQMTFTVIPQGGGSSKIFAVSDKTPEINWNIGTETRVFQGMPCQKATATYKGRDYEAWFTSQVPYSNGPWKLGGLPGLILEAYDTKREVVFAFESFENVQGKGMMIDMPENAIKTSPKEYKQYEEAMRKDAAAARGSSAGVASMSNISVRGAANGGAPPKPKQNNNPIEKQQ